MFSIAAINDTDSRNQWQPLAPTKEAQEFRLSQLYHDGLLRLRAKDYDKARELLESVLEDPLISNTQGENNASGGHLLQLRFLALKNLGTVLLQQGPTYYESALQCYLKAVDIDGKDSVLWNQLGTLSCSMGSLSISRWAFEQGLVCSPNNWNCMEKLLEVLISIGDEVACLSVSKLILGHWPSHSRALHVKNTIEESEHILFAPRGIDKLLPRHARLKFSEKREASDRELTVSKKLKQNIEVQLSEASWIALACELMKILLPLSVPSSEQTIENQKSGDVSVSIQLPSSSAKVTNFIEMKGFACKPGGPNMPVVDHSSTNDKEGTALEEQPQERRSSRLERLRARKPGKEELEFSTNKDCAKVVKQYLLPYLVDGARTINSEHNSEVSLDCSEEASNLLDSESADVIAFVQSTYNNCGAYHLSHLLLEKIADRGILHQDTIVEILDLEKLTRHWGQERTPECSLFLSELYYDIGLRSSETSKKCSFMSEASYHLCKIIEFIAIEFPFHVTGVDEKENCNMTDVSEKNYNTVMDSNSLSNYNHRFWIRFFWLSGHLSQLDGDEVKAQKELSVVSSLFMDKEKMNCPCVDICLPHCKANKKLSLDRILHEINLIEVNNLLKGSVSDMLEKNMHAECVALLAPLLLSVNDVRFDVLCGWGHEGRGFISIELSALDVLIKSRELVEQTYDDVYLGCHRRKLQILLARAGLEGSSIDNHAVSFSESQSNENLWRQWNYSVAEEVKAISQSASKIKSTINSIDFISMYASISSFTDIQSQKLRPKQIYLPKCHSEIWNKDVDGNSCVDQLCETCYHPGPISVLDKVPMEIVGDIQCLLLTLMCNIANLYFSKKSSGIGVPDSIEQAEQCYFVEAAIAFCKLQHLNLNASIKSQTELVVAMHDMLAEFGICCARGTDESEEGTFLKLAIKHLLTLDVKLKSNIHSPNKEQESKFDLHISSNDQFTESDKLSHGSPIPGSPNVSPPRVPDNELDKNEMDTANTLSFERLSSESIPSCLDKENPVLKSKSNIGHGPDGAHSRGDIGNNHIECGDELADDEREELELSIDNALDQCFYCLYGLNLRSDSSCEEDLVTHKNTSQGDYQTKEQCADVFQYVLPYAKASSRTGLVKLRRVLRTIRKHFPQPPDDVLARNAIDKFLDNPELCEDKLLKEAESNGFLDSTMKTMFLENSFGKQQNTSSVESSDPYLEVYCNLYYLLAQSEEMSATDKWAGFVLTNEGEEFVEQNANLFKYDLIYNPMRFESWQRLANLYDEEVDLLLNDGSKQINVLGWRRNSNLPQRVEASRRRSRRCLLMTLALAKTATQQGEIHELLALVYYDGLQNVVPFYDQRSIIPLKGAEWKIFCENALSQFKKALRHKEDWSQAFYVGKLCEKLGYSHDIVFSYYTKAIALNPSAVDPFYRMHASRLKLLCKCGKQDEEALKVVAAHSFVQTTKEYVMNIFGGLACENSKSSLYAEDGISCTNSELRGFHQFEKIWNLLYSDCLSALETCVEGDLKHFHKARYMLSQGLYQRGGPADLEKAKEELSFCFKSSRSSFTINMWEIESMVKKGRRKTQGPCGNKRVLEVHLAESSRKFITCIRKYTLFYLKLLEEAGDISTLDRAYIFLRADKRFSVCLEDLVPVALMRYIKALTMCICQVGPGSDDTTDSIEHLLERLFNLFLERFNLWNDIFCLPELKGSELTESGLYGYLYDFIQLLERNVKVETLEGINEKIRKRLKNPKLSNSICAKLYRHVSAAWCRSLVISMAVITPLLSRLSTEICDMNLMGGGLESNQLLCVDLQSEELWSSAFEDSNHLKNLETTWNPSLSKIKNVIIKKVSDEDLETAAALLRSSYNFYKDTSCALLPSGINLYIVPAQLATETYIQPGIDGVDIIDMNTSRKLLLWAYSLLHGHCPNISHVIKYCEENAKLRIKKGTGGSSTPPSAHVCTATATQSGGMKDGIGRSSEQEVHPLPPFSPVAPLPETQNIHKLECSNLVESGLTRKGSSTLPKNAKIKNLDKYFFTENEGKCITSDSQPEARSSCKQPALASSSLFRESTNGENCDPSDEKNLILPTTHLLQCNDSDAELSS